MGTELTSHVSHVLKGILAESRFPQETRERCFRWNVDEIWEALGRKSSEAEGMDA